MSRTRRRRRGGLPVHFGTHRGSSCGLTLLIGTGGGGDGSLALGSQPLRLLRFKLLLCTHRGSNCGLALLIGTGGGGDGRLALGGCHALGLLHLHLLVSHRFRI